MSALDHRPNPESCWPKKYDAIMVKDWVTYPVEVDSGRGISLNERCESVTRRKNADQAQITFQLSLSVVHYRREIVALFPNGHQLLRPVIAPPLPICKAVAPTLTLTHSSEMLRARPEVPR